MKKFLLKICYTVLPLWLFFVGITAYYQLYVAPNMVGDLAGLGKIPTRAWQSDPTDTTMTDTLYRDVTDAEELRHAKKEVLVCGDSFSQLGEVGWNSYLAKMIGRDVLNYKSASGILPNPLQTAYELMRDGYVDSTTVKTFIVESVERSLLQRISEFAPASHTLALTAVGGGDDLESNTAGSSGASWSLTEAKNWLLLRLGVRNRVRSVTLSKPFFSGIYPDKLLYYRDDIKGNFSIPQTGEPVVKAVVDSLFNMAGKRGVKLLLLIAPDKYDLYQDYVIDNRYPRKTINEDLRRIVGEREDVIIAKELLLPQVKAGEKDVYKQNDTHWSFTAAKQVATHIFNLQDIKNE